LMLNSPVERATRKDGKVFITSGNGQTARYDGVVMASHSDQTLKMLADCDSQEKSVLSSIPYRPNRVWLHRDPALMPKRRDAWAAWNYLGTKTPGSTREITVTYWMNRLQNINTKYPIFITLNPQIEPREELTFATFDYSHPQFDAAALAAQERLPSIQGRNNTWYCGAWTRFGFHEDGLASGLAAASLLGCSAPWEPSEASHIESQVNPEAILEAVA